MGVKFFGQFLIDQGEVDASHVRDALERMAKTNATLGEIAVELGFMNPRDATHVAALQRSCDMNFGDLAVKMNFLETDELVDCVARQQSTRLPIGEALVQLGVIGSDRLETLLDRYKVDQAQYEVKEIGLPDGLTHHPVARYVIELLPRFLMRVAQMQAKAGEISSLDEVPAFGEVRVSVSLEGARGLEVALVSDRAFAETLAMAASGLLPQELDPEMVADGVGEFLNVLAGNAASAVTKTGHRVELGPPDYDAEICDGWVVDLAVGAGQAALVLSTF